MKEIAGRTVFITGAAQGIGFAFAKAFANAGARVALADIDAGELAVAEKELMGITEVASFQLDVRDRRAMAAAADGAEQRLGPVSILCNNAGIGVAAPVSEMTYELWDDVLGINLGGTVNGIQTFLPRMVARGGPGHLVNVASGAGLVPSDRYLYCTSKYAVVGLSESLRQHSELTERQIGVSVVCPGFVRTNIMRNSQRFNPAVSAVSARDPVAEARDGIFERFGLDPDIVSEQVLRAVHDNRLYVHTDRMMIGGIQQRTQALLDDMPTETERDREILGALRAEIEAALRSERTCVVAEQ